MLIVLDRTHPPRQFGVSSAQFTKFRNLTQASNDGFFWANHDESLWETADMRHGQTLPMHNDSSETGEALTQGIVLAELIGDATYMKQDSAPATPPSGAPRAARLPRRKQQPVS
jgi:hypothetical protein